MIFVQGEYLTNVISKVNGYPPNSDEAAGTISYLVRAFCRCLFLQHHTIFLRNITLISSTKLPAIYITIQGVQDQPGRQRSRNTGNPDR